MGDYNNYIQKVSDIETDIDHKNNKIDDLNNTLDIEIKYHLNDIFIKDNTIEILKLLITGVLLSFIILMINKITTIPIPIINVVTIIMTIFLFLVFIRILRNMNKRTFNFREYKYSQHPGDRTFWGKLSHMLYNAIPSIKKKKHREVYDLGGTEIAAGNV